ncbi:MAG TPA: heme o synthase [Longimicrobiales bacterium]
MAAKPSLPSYAASRGALYLELTKPGISLFVALSAVTGYVVAAGAGAQWLPAGLVLICTMLMSGGAAALNHVVEADRDRSMRRTANRPVAARHIEAHEASFFAWTLTICGLALALATLPPMVATFLVLSHISYVNIYTPLKTRTPLCTLAGALPGSLPVLAGAAGAADGVTLAAVLLTALLFTWQMPHFMAIGWLARDDYARARYAMLFLTEPSGGQSAAVAVQYAAAMGGCAVLLAVATSATWLFTMVALATGAALTWLAIAFRRDRARETARRLFFASLLVLPALLVTLMLEVLVLR